MMSATVLHEQPSVARKKRFSEPPGLVGIHYSRDLVEQTRVSGRLLRINIEIGTGACNIKCLYCYSSSNHTTGCPHPLTDAEIKSVVLQAKALGTRSVVLTGGGEPMLDLERFFRVVDLVRGFDLDVAVFTNGTRISAAVAEHLAANHVTVITKLNSLSKPEVTDTLSGHKHAHELMEAALKNLLATPLAEEKRLGLETVITRMNVLDIQEMWRWARDRRIYPYFELVHIEGRAIQNADTLLLSKEEIKCLFQQLLQVDRERYGFDWIPVPPIPGSRCDRLYCGCYVCLGGTVQPCAGLPIPIGNVRQSSLAEILNSETIRRLREPKKYLAGKCSQCQYLGFCYGCRGDAFGSACNPFSTDTMCWR
ncbi:MAG: radical SAM protein [Verrucomicrobiia bacterium]|jgi:radical SAM protein with 4Fe4S-binding SPASM domain